MSNTSYICPSPQVPNAISHLLYFGVSAALVFLTDGLDFWYFELEKSVPIMNVDSSLFRVIPSYSCAILFYCFLKYFHLFRGVLLKIEAPAISNSVWRLH